MYYNYMENPGDYIRLMPGVPGYEVLEELFSSVDQQDIIQRYNELDIDVQQKFEEHILGPNINRNNNNQFEYVGEPHVYYYNNNNYIIFENRLEAPEEKYRIIREETGEDGIGHEYSRGNVIHNFRLLSNFREAIRRKTAVESEITRLSTVYETVKDIHKYDPYFNLEKNEFLDLIAKKQRILKVSLKPLKYRHCIG